MLGHLAWDKIVDLDVGEKPSLHQGDPTCLQHMVLACSANVKGLAVSGTQSMPR
jgi:hypothetical protein